MRLSGCGWFGCFLRVCGWECKWLWGVFLCRILQVGGDKKSESVGEGFLKGAKLCNQVLSFDGILGDKRVFIRVTKKAKILKK